MGNEKSDSWGSEALFEDGVNSMIDMMSRLASRLSSEYETKSCLDAAVVVLTELTGWPSVVIDRNGQWVAGTLTLDHRYPSLPKGLTTTTPIEIDGWLCMAIPSIADYVMCAETVDGAVDDATLLILSEIVALTAFELRIEEAVVREQFRVDGDLALAMLSGSDQQRIHALSAVVGHDLETPHRVGLIADGRIGLSADQVRSAVRRSGEIALVAPWGANIAVIFDDKADADGILGALDQVVPGGNPWMGVSSVKEQGYDLSEAVAEAGVALSFGQLTRESRTINYRDLGVFRLFSPDGRWTQLEDFVNETLGPLIEYDRDHGSELVHTLDAYLRRNGSLNQLADSLMIHRSTLVYRLRRIRELLAVDIDDSALRLDLSLAARAVEVLNATAGMNSAWVRTTVA